MTTEGSNGHVINHFTPGGYALTCRVTSRAEEIEPCVHRYESVIEQALVGRGISITAVLF